MDTQIPFAPSDILRWAEAQPKRKVIGECHDPASCIIAQYAFEHIPGLLRTSVVPGNTILFGFEPLPTNTYESQWQASRRLSDDENAVARAFDHMHVNKPTYGKFIKILREMYPAIA